MTIEDVSREIADLVAACGDYVYRLDTGGHGSGTALLWKKEGFAIGAAHSLRHEHGIKLVGGDGAEIPATLSGFEPRLDLALLELDGEKASRLKGPDASRFNTTEDPRVGNLVFAIGRPGIGPLDNRSGREEPRP